MRPKPVFGSRPFGKRDGRLLLVAYFDPNGIGAIPQGIAAWQALSRHEIILLNLWPGRAGAMRLPQELDFDEFDGVVIHPTVSYSPASLDVLDIGLKTRLPSFDGVKVLMKQDEQVLAGRLPGLVRDKGFDVVLTCLPPAEQEKVYPRSLIGQCTLQQVLTGYVSPEMRGGFPAHKRDIQLSYRGSIQPLAFGRLGYEKRGIGYDMAKAVSTVPSIRFDISSRWEDRLSGEEWETFLARSGVVLGVESGSNVFDLDGSVARWCDEYERQQKHEDATSHAYYRTAHDEFLHAFEGNVNYAQIAPRNFEAAAAGAAQMLYEGEYSGILVPGRHFFPLQRDLANIDAAIDFIRDDATQRLMAERSYEEIILDPKNWSETFVSSVDDLVDAKLVEKGRRRSGTSPSKPRQRPVAYLLASGDPSPRARRFAASLAETHEGVVIAAGGEPGEAGVRASLERGTDGVALLRVERATHDAGWLPSSSQLRQGHHSVARALLASLVGYSAAPAAVLNELLGAHIAAASEMERFRSICADLVNVNATLLGAVENLGAPDIVIASGFETLFAAAGCGELHGAHVVFDAEESWPSSFADFQHWEIEFWTALEANLAKLADICLAATPQLARKMGREYAVTFHGLIAPVLETCRKSPLRSAGGRPDFRWIETPRGPSPQSARTVLLPPAEIFGGYAPDQKDFQNLVSAARRARHRLSRVVRRA